MNKIAKARKYNSPILQELLNEVTPLEMDQTKVQMQYMEYGGQIFTITKIGKIKGGDITIDTTKFRYFVNKDTKKLHYSYPMTEDNLIKDELLISYIFKRFDDHLVKTQEYVKLNSELLLTIKSKN